ncbi:MAG: GerMN domain-containing protein [Firmicutes bacterium]|nr:GerMN domain-containing protein [Bacillota bacterium]
MKRCTKRRVIALLIMAVVLITGCGTFDRYEDDRILQTNEGGNNDIDSIDSNDATANSSNDYEGGGEGKLEENNTNTDINNNENKETEEMLIEVYYQDNEGFLVPVTRRVPKQLSIARASINALIDTPMNREEIAYFGLYPILPQETEFTINIKEGIAVIDFNNKVLEYNDQIVEYNIVASVVYTLTQFETVDEVKILVNGYIQQRLRYGTDISENLSRKNILVNTAERKSINLARGMQKLDVYLLKTIKNNVYIIPVSIECMNLNEDNLQGEIIKYLSTPPENQKLFSEVPDNIRLIGSSIKEGLLTLNLSIDIGSYGGTQREYGMISQILYSMRQIDGIDRIRFLIDGEVKDFIEGTEISKPVPLPLSINDIVDI